jgi:serine/threonine-protein kinase HipA
MHDSGSIVSDWEEGRRALEGPIANLLLLTLGNGAGDSINERAEGVWRRSANWRESWRQVSAVPTEPTQVDESTFSKIFPGAEIPFAQSVHGFPFVDHGLPREVYGLQEGVWRGIIPAKDHPPAYLWMLERSGAFLYREKIWEDDKTSITAGHIHVGSVLEISAATVFFIRRLAERVPLAPKYRLTLDLNGMKGRGVVAQREGMPSDTLLVDHVEKESAEDHRSASIDTDLDTIASSPLAVVYDLVAEGLLDLRPDLANRAKLERHLRLRHASDDRRGGTRFLGFLDDIFDGKPPRRAVVSLSNRRVGLLVETTWGSRFTYDRRYVERAGARPLSPKMPVRSEPYETSGLLPFFENLLPEGAQLEIVARHRGLNPQDKFGILLATLPSSIGDVQIYQEEKVETP